MVDNEMLEAMRELIWENNKVLIEQFNVVLESSVIPQIKTVAEGHSNIMERLPKVDEVEELKSRVRVLERIIKEHSKAIESFLKAQ